MKYLIGWLIGVGTMWAALAIWQRLPEFPNIDDIDPAEMDDLDRIVYLGERPDVQMRNKFPPPPVTDPKAFMNVSRMQP